MVRNVEKIDSEGAGQKTQVRSARLNGGRLFPAFDRSLWPSVISVAGGNFVPSRRSLSRRIGMVKINISAPDFQYPSPDSRLYFLQDANWDTTAVVGFNSTTGTWGVTQRYVYSPYGSITILSADWTTPPAGTQPVVNNLYQGMTLDAVTGLYYERFRNYSPSLGTWISQDPLSYVNGANTYQFVGSNPVFSTDPQGMAQIKIDVPLGKGIIEIGEAIKNVEELAKFLDKPLSYVPGVTYYAQVDWSNKGEPAITGEADIEGGKLCSAQLGLSDSVEASVSVGAEENFGLIQGKLGIEATVSAEVSAWAKYSSQHWTFGGSAQVGGRVDLFGILSAWFIQAKAYGGAQLVGEARISSAGELDWSLKGQLVGGVQVQDRSFWSDWETIFSSQVVFGSDTLASGHKDLASLFEGAV